MCVFVRTCVRLCPSQEREEQRKAAAFREQLLAEKGLTIDQLQSPRKKVVYDRKKKKNLSKPAKVDETTQASVELESAKEQQEQTVQLAEPTAQEETIRTETETVVSENRPTTDSLPFVIARVL